MGDFIEVHTTTERREDAERIANAVAEKRLAACTQITGPVASTYWWKGSLETTQEWSCRIKSRKALYGELEKAIQEMHPYETPEIIALPIVAGSSEYLEWLGNELKRG